VIVDCVEAAPEINGPPRMLAGMAGRVSSPVLVGRRGELEQLIGAIDRTASGETNHVLIAGEAGVGKTRTTAEAAEQARRRGFRVLTGHCVSVGGSGLPYGPLVEALRDLAGSMDPVDLRAVAGPAATDLARLVPGFASGGAAAPAQSEWVQARLFEALLGLLGRLTERSPVLLVVEDLHWADPATLETISFLVHSLQSVPFLLLATYRSDELHRRHPLLPWLAELERSGRVERLELDRLDRPAILALVRGILDTDPPPDLVGEIFERSDGNPFFAEELVAACRDDDVLRLPSTLREILVAHVGRLPDSAAAVLRVAAVAGRRVEHDLLASVAGLPGRELDDGLRAAVMGHVLVVEADGDDERYAFRHALVQEVVYDELLPGERRRLHRALAEALEADGAGAHDSEAGHWAELAHHWAQAHEERKAFEADWRRTMRYASADLFVAVGPPAPPRMDVAALSPLATVAADETP